MDATDNKRFEEALALLEERRFAEAVDSFSELIALNPDLTGAYGNRGLAYLNLGLLDEAENDFQTVLQIDAEDAMGHSMLAEAARHRGDCEEALRRVAEALDINPDEPQAHFIRGWLFAKAGQYEMAAEDLSRFIQLSGENEDAAELLEACTVLAAENPRDEGGDALDSPDKIDRFLGMRGWSFGSRENPDYEEQGLPCPYAHCIRNQPPLSPESPDGCPVFGYSCPGRREQVQWCREHPARFD